MVSSHFETACNGLITLAPGGETGGPSTNMCPPLPLQVPGVHAPQPLPAQPLGAVWRGPAQRPLLGLPGHAALRHGEAPVRLPLPAHERQPADGLRQPDEPGPHHGLLPAHGLAAHPGQHFPQGFELGLVMVNVYMLYLFLDVHLITSRRYVGKT